VSRSGGHRTERLGALIQEAIADAIATKVKDPRVGFVTITGVTGSGDLKHATVNVSVMGTEDEKQTAMDGLEAARGYLRSLLARRIETRSVPELHLVLDRGLEHAARIESLIQKIKTDGPDR